MGPRRRSNRGHIMEYQLRDKRPYSTEYQLEMGSCLSSSYSEQPLTAKVIALNGTLRQYSIILTVSDILELESAQSSSFMCNSDSLCYNEFIQPLIPKEEIHMGEIYFILPSNRLKSRLSVSDMAALAVKASLAIGNKESSGSSSRRRRGQPMRVSPLLDLNQRSYGDDRLDVGINRRFEQKPMVNGIARSGSVRKLQRNASKRAKMAIRSFRLSLTTIHEGTVAA